VKDRVDVGKFGLERARIDRDPSVLGEPARLDDGRGAVLRHAKEKIVSELLAVVELGDDIANTGTPKAGVFAEVTAKSIASALSARSPDPA
jgi:hypothetical protein